MSAELERLWALAFREYSYYSFARSTALAEQELSELPRWLAARQAGLKTRWRPEALWTAYLKGKRLQIFLDWLMGPSRG